MKPSLPSSARHVASLLPCLALLACGAGQTIPGTPESSAQPVAPVTAPPAPTPPAVSPTPPVPPVTAPPPPQQPAAPAPAVVSGAVTDVIFQSTATSGTQVNVPLTFGQVFARGDLSPGVSLSGQLANGATVPLQMDAKAYHPDGSVRHAILSALLPSLPAGDLQGMSLVRTAAAPATTSGTPADLLSAGFSAAVGATVDGQLYTASADSLLKNPGYKTWLAGPVVTEWQVSAPLKTAQGVEHPHLSARFSVRWYSAIRKARVDVTVENDWAYAAAPRNFVYDAQISVGGQKVYAKPALNHFHHARWRKTFWWGETPQVHIKHNAKYLIASQAVPNYDQSLVIPEATLAAIGSQWTGSRIEPMGTGLIGPAMPNTGGRTELGLLPGWSVMYLLSMDKRAKDAMLGNADLAGSWSAHYRDRGTDRPISLMDYPYMTLLGNPGDTYNPITKKSEGFPSCAVGGTCSSPNIDDSSHQPGFAYLPYLVTGDYYYLEELQFWAMRNVFSSNPGYRQNIKGLLKSDQVRGQAWSLRTLAEAAYITPAQDPLKAHFDTVLESNLDWYNATYTNNASANALGVIINGFALGYYDGTGLAPWMDDFFTAAVGYASELGFSKAEPLLAWKAKFPIARMTDPGFCWIRAAMYEMKVMDTPSSALYSTIAQAYTASTAPVLAGLTCAGADMATNLQLKVGEMTGYSAEATGFPSNLQPALAYSAKVGGKRGADAWAQFMARSVKPNYSSEPQFAIIPR